MPSVDLRDAKTLETFTGFHGRVVHSEHMTFVYWDIDEGATLPEHAHPHEQVAHVLEGQFEIFIGGQKHVLGPGSVGIIPPNAKHLGKALTRCKIIDAFYPVREDYK